MGLVAPQHVGSSQTRARTRVPCIGRQILNPWAIREAPKVHAFFTPVWWPLSLTTAHCCAQASLFYHVMHHASFWCCQSLRLRVSVIVLERGLNLLAGLKYSPLLLSLLAVCYSPDRVTEITTLDFSSVLLLLLKTFLLCPWFCFLLILLPCPHISSFLDSGQRKGLKANRC